MPVSIKRQHLNLCVTILSFLFLALESTALVSKAGSELLTLADYYPTNGSLNWGKYAELASGPHGRPLVLNLQGRSTDCVLRYHSRTDEDPRKVHAPADRKGGYIPVLGITAPLDPKLFLLRLLYSIDFPVYDIVIVTGGDHPLLMAEMDHVFDNLANITHVHCSNTQSVTQGWNQIVTTYMEASWVMMSAIDVQFQPGSLARFADRFWAEIDQGIEMAHFTYPNLRLGAYNQLFNVFAVTRTFLGWIGLWDENIWPAYCEDEEWMIRATISKHALKSATFHGVSAFHGRRNHDSKHLSGIRHFGKLGQLAQKRHLRNCMYVKLKWGCTQNYNKRCLYKTPFNISGKPVSYWRFNTSPFISPESGNPLTHGLVDPLGKQISNKPAGS